MMPSPDEARPAEEPPADVLTPQEPLEDLGVSAAVCPQCTTKVTWKGVITDDMIARTFTRGFDDATGLPNCPRCGTAMQAPAGAPAEEAIATAAAAVPEAVEERAARQMHIPGLRPAFDYQSALESILQQRRVVRHAEASAEAKSKEAQRARKHAEEEQDELSKLEDEFEDRIAEVHADAALTPAQRRAKGCAFEKETGTPCSICAAEVYGERADNTTPAHLVAVASDLARQGDLRATDLARVLERVGLRVVDRGDIERWTKSQIAGVVAWLAAETRDAATSLYPPVLGQAHEAGADGKCRTCEADLPAPSTFGHDFEQWPDGTQIGTNCPGKRKKKRRETTTEQLVALLAQGGAVVSEAAIAKWTGGEKVDAVMWAEAQIEARRKDKSGHETSVRWPEHVSIAVSQTREHVTPTPAEPRRRASDGKKKKRSKR